MADNMNVTSTNAGATTAKVTGNAQRLLGEGDAGAEVLALQQQLAKLGFNPGTADGIFGPHTTSALKQFQAKQGIPADGVLGPNTRAALEKATPAPAKDANGVSANATAAAGAKDQNHDIMNYPANGTTAPKAPANAPAAPSRLDEQKKSAQNLLDQLATNAKVAAIAFNPIFAPAALAISAQANARAIQRYETEVPQKDFNVIMAEESDRATKEILNLPSVYAQAGLKGVQAVETGALAVAGVVVAGGAWAYNTTVNGVTTAYNAAANGVNTAYNAAANGVTTAYNTAVDYGSQAVTTAEDYGNKAASTTKKVAKAWWHIETAPLRWLGKGLSAVGKFFGGIGG